MILVDVIAYMMPLLIRYVTDNVFPYLKDDSSMLSSLYFFGGLMLFTGVMRGLMAHFMIRLYWFVGESVVRDIRNALFEKLQHLQAPFYDTARTGDLMSRVTSDVQMIRNFFAFGVEHRLRIILISLTVLGFMLWQNWRLALMVYCFIPLVFFMVVYFSNKMGKAVAKKYRQTGTLSSFIQENLRGIRIVKALAMEEEQMKNFDKENSALRDAGMEVADLQAKMNPLLILTSSVGSLVILFYGGSQIINGTDAMTLGTLLGFMSYLAIMGFPLFILAFNTSLLSLASGAALRIQEILSKKDQRQENTGHHRSSIEGALEFRNVYFSYPESNGVLQDVSFSIEPGERVAVFGLTGSGKSSLISLIPRFYEPSSGEILLDNVPLKDWDLEYLRSRMGMVLQESFLFSMSILDNIAYGKPNASMKEIEQAAKSAQIHDFILSLPEGYQSKVGEFGMGLSGGQRQRLAIARALLKDPRLLILDDCTSSLDSGTEREIQKELQNLMARRTTLIIAQRISTLRLADRIILLHDGKIHHMDSHEKLLKKSSLYRSAYETQMFYGSIGEDSITGRTC
ncbi:MAG: ABC transporter ATP-binding protein [Spirochaetaceae bacterium]|jgi:ABC-type multidrug transport system fused ATPase/permease subunit|nr:ABC transporter ATP-binding protein [Spirochaetaceae bacterium]